VSDRDFGATYRVQLHGGFTLDDAARIVPYLARLGVTHVYCSPYLQSTAGSTHGYDVVDHTKIDPELGGDAALTRFCAALEEHGMGHILDIVPNHVAVAGRENPAWWDVLKHGPNGRFGRFFDIDWDPPEPRLKGKVLLPILGDRYGAVLERGELSVVETGDEQVVRYFEHEFPLAPGTLAQLLGDDAVERVNREPALLHTLLERQYYRLAYWRTDIELNYRRFFDINELVALRMEDQEVFDHVHRLPLELLENGRLDGLRVDHVDGLRQPGRYLDELRRRAEDALVVVEKITERDERLPEEWQVDGTTGYEFLNLVGGLFVDPSAEGAFTHVYEEIAGARGELRDQVLEAKHQVMTDLLGADVERLTQRLLVVCERHPRHRDYTRAEVRDAVRETIASLDVYRTYVDPDSGQVSPADEARIHDIVEDARKRRPDLDPSLFGFIGGVLTLEQEGDAEADFVLRFQQTTGPVMAKAVEDTVFYRYVRFAALNEVGGDPAAFGTSIEEFHRRMEDWPRRSLLATSTHDTKRSEDVRARLAVLSEVPDGWGAAVSRWREMNERHKRDGWPDPATEYLLYQTLVGAHPLPAERAAAYMEKATKEAKDATSWVDPNEEYDAAVRAFVTAVIEDRAFREDLDAFVRPLVEPGRINSLAQLLIKLTAPGIPDVYQGTELWDLSLVDPDNRRPVDYEERARALETAAGAAESLAAADRGAPKMFVLTRALRLRRADPEAFRGGYEPLHPEGPGAEHLVAYRRSERVAVVVPRLVLSRPEDWTEARVHLGSGTWHNALTGEDVPADTTAGALLDSFPVALLTRA